MEHYDWSQASSLEIGADEASWVPIFLSGGLPSRYEVLFGGAVLLLAMFLRGSWRVLKHADTSGHVSCEFAVALRSACIYVAMVLPVFILVCEPRRPGSEKVFPVNRHTWEYCPESPYWFLPTKLMRVYHWLPFWLAYMVSTHLGGLVMAAWQLCLGTLTALLAASLLNCIMPGGAGPLSQDPDFTRDGWFPFSTPFFFAFAIAFVYSLHAFGRSVGATQYALSTFSAMLIAFANPNSEKSLFRALVWDASKPPWGSRMLCEVLLVPGLALFLSIFALGLRPWSRSSCEKHSCKLRAAKGLAKLADDNTEYLARLLEAYCKEGTNFDATFSFFCIRHLGVRRTAIEVLLQQATWECCAKASKTQLQRLWNFADLLRNVRQVLRVELEHQRCLGRAPRKLGSIRISNYLDSFMIACEEAMSLFSKDSHLLDGIDNATSKAILQATARADASLISALQQLKADMDGGDNSVALDMVFVDGLRSWPSAITKALEQHAEGLQPEQQDRTWMSRAQHLNALKNTTAWVLALLWSMYKREFDGGCVATVSTIFLTSSGTGSSFDKNINRMVGVGMGLAAGNMPSILLMQRGLDGKYELVPYGLPVYLISMFIMWTVAMYGYLATGSKYSYACLLWVAYASMQMLRHLEHLENWKTLHTSASFMTVIDNFLACFIIFIVDMVFQYCTDSNSSEVATAAVSDCLRGTALLVDELREGKPTDASLLSLQERIKRARHRDTETRHEGLVWTNLWEVPYKADSVHLILECCDDVHVAINSMQASMARCRDKALAQRIIREVLDKPLATRCHRHVRATRAVMAEALDSELIDQLLYGQDVCEGEIPLATTHEAPEDTEKDAASKAAAIALRSGAWALRLSIRRVGVVLAERSCYLRKKPERVGRILEGLLDPRPSPPGEQPRKRRNRRTSSSKSL